LGLTSRATLAGGVDDSACSVEFAARFKVAGKGAAGKKSAVFGK